MSTVGRAPPPAEGSGNQWILIFVPSNDVNAKSEGIPVTAVAVVDRQSTGGRHVLEDVGDPHAIEEVGVVWVNPTRSTAKARRGNHNPLRCMETVLAGLITLSAPRFLFLHRRPTEAARPWVAGNTNGPDRIGIADRHLSTIPKGWPRSPNR